MTILEAFANGLPVVSSKLGSMEFSIIPGYNGLHFLPGDYHDLIAKVSWAWENIEKIRWMAANARMDYENKYTIESNYDRMIEIYTKVLQSKQTDHV